MRAMHRPALALTLLVACSKPTTEATPTPSAIPPTQTSASAVGSASGSASASASASPSAAPPDFKTFPNTPAGAKSLVSEFLKPGVDAAALSKQLRPASADYKAVFDAATAAKIDAVYSPEWDKGSFVVQARPGQTEVKISSATVADFKAANEKAKDFPSGYAKLAPRLVGASTIYRFRFVEPGQEQGNAYDGLVYVNGHWVLIPKPWRGLDDHH
ncbi:MAG: hypothetical protein JWM74_5994 [Myxococcaceae bacterium]|nr:hypothetical protein [Myxococcaceae bacterium]